MLEKMHLTNIFLEKHKCVREQDVKYYYRGGNGLKMSVADQIENFMASVTNQDCYFLESSQQENTGHIMTHSDEDYEDYEYQQYQMNYSEYGFQLKMLTDQEELLLKIPDCDSTAKFSLSISTQISITLRRGVDIKEKLKKAGFQIEVQDFPARDFLSKDKRWKVLNY